MLFFRRVWSRAEETRVGSCSVSPNTLCRSRSCVQRSVCAVTRQVFWLTLARTAKVRRVNHVECGIIDQFRCEIAQHFIVNIGHFTDSTVPIGVHLRAKSVKCTSHVTIFRRSASCCPRISEKHVANACSGSNATSF